MKDSDWEILNELYHNPNMSKVANLLYMSQPSLTKRLQHMEEEFGVAIVNRTPKGLKFTPEGEFLGKQAEKYMIFLEETRKRLEEMRESGMENIVIGSSYTFSKYTLSEILIQYREEHPYVHFTVINESSDLLFRKMLDGSVDVGFVRGDYEGAVNRVLVGKNCAYLVTKDPVDLNQLPAMQFYGYKTNRQTMEIIGKWWRDQFGTELPPNMVVGYVDVTWQLISHGDGFTCCFLPDNFVNEYNLTLTPLTDKDGKPVTRNTWFIYSRSKRLPVVLEEFIQYVTRKFRV